jgi:peptidoglycan hydrolase-like protein with peptidoglycan-binding domain
MPDFFVVDKCCLMFISVSCQTINRHPENLQGFKNMPRILTMTMEISDKEAENYLERLFTRSDVEITGDSGGQLATAIATPSAPVTPAATGTLDKNGVEWNASFHATTKTMKADGTWKAAKSMDAEVKAAAAIYNATPAAPAPVTVNEVMTPAAPVAPTPPAAPVAPTPPAAPVAAPVLPIAPVAPPVPAPVSFEELSAAFGVVIARVGQDALMAVLGQIYTDAGTDVTGSTLQTNETHRALVFNAINAL